MTQNFRSGACGPQDCELVPFGERRLNPNQVPGLRPRIWYVVSNRNPDGTLKPAPAAGGLGLMVALQFYTFEVPESLCLWSMSVDYPTIDGLVIVGDNQVPIPVRASVLFNLSTVEFPCMLCGPLKVYIQGGVIPGDPAIAVPVNWYAILAEAGDNV